MLTFLYIGLILGSTSSIIFFMHLNERYLNEDNPKKTFNNHLTESFIKSFLLSFFILLFMCVILPFIIWNLGNKDIVLAEKIIDTENIYPLYNTNSKVYVGKSTSDNKTIYVINLSNENNTNNQLYLDIDSTNISYTKKNNTPYYEQTKVYKIKKLTSNNFISKAVNEMYADVYTNFTRAELETEKSNLYIPAKSSIGDYKIK